MLAEARERLHFTAGSEKQKVLKQALWRSVGKGLFNVDGFWGAAGAKMSMGGRRGALNAHCSSSFGGSKHPHSRLLVVNTTKFLKSALC